MRRAVNVIPFFHAPRGSYTLVRDMAAEGFPVRLTCGGFGILGVSVLHLKQ